MDGENDDQGSDDTIHESFGNHSPTMALGTLGIDDETDDQGTDGTTHEDSENSDEQDADDSECFEDPEGNFSSDFGSASQTPFTDFSFETIVNRATILTEELKAGLRRAQSSKEGPAIKTQDNYCTQLKGAEDQEDYLHSFGRAKSTGAVTRSAIRQAHDDETFFEGLIGDIKAGVDILERTLSKIVGSESRKPQESKKYQQDEIRSEIRGGSEQSFRNRSTTPSDAPTDPNVPWDFTDEAYPIEEVDLIVPKTDDPSIPFFTFRVFVLGLFSCILVTFLNTYFSFRTEPIVITTTTSLIIATPLGRFMASTLPAKYVRIPGTQRGFSLNPGPFTMKEHALITIFSSAGSIRPGGIFVFTMIKIYLKGDMKFLPSFLVTLTCELLGLGWSILLYKFLVEPVIMWWPQAIINVSLIQGLYFDKGKGLSPLRFFGIAFIGAFAYYTIPGYFIPSLSSVSVVCLMFKHNMLAQQLGSGARGLGLGSVTFDWGAISGFLSSPLVVPWNAALNILVGFVVQAYVIVPITYWKNWFHTKNYPIFSPDLYYRSGQQFNVTRILNSDNLHLKHGALSGSHEDLTYSSAFFTTSTGFGIALSFTICSQVIFFHGKDMLQIFLKAWRGQQSQSIDVHTKLMSRYRPVPIWWGVVMVVASTLVSVLTAIVYSDQVDIKVWVLFAAFALAVFMMLPTSVLVATTNQIAHLGVLPHYLGGILQAGRPVSNALFRVYSTVLCSRTSTYLANFKFGYFMHIPPIATFFAQLSGTVVAALVSTLVTLWLSNSVDNICEPSKLPANTPWTCPVDRYFYDQVIMFGLVGTKRVFTESNAPFRALHYYVLPGVLVPAVAWLLAWVYPHWRWVRYINATLVIRGAYSMPPSSVVNNLMWILLALFFSTYVFTYHRSWWKRYNFCLSAALDSGTVAMALLQYYSLDEDKKLIHWWGRRSNADHCPLASCSRGAGPQRPGCPVY